LRDYLGITFLEKGEVDAQLTQTMDAFAKAKPTSAQRSVA
jgi:hypothetical protein